MGLNKRNRGRCGLPVVAGIVLGMLGGPVQAAGFMIQEQSVHEVGRAVAGASAAADSPATAFFNPAGITRLEGTRAAAALHVIVPQADFSGSASLNPLLGGAAYGSTGGAEGGTGAVVPNLYYVRDLAPGLKFGLAINAPFGLATEYDDGWIGRYHALRSELLTVNLNPVLAVRVGERLSLGFGLSAVYARAELTNALDLSGACLGLEAGAQLPAGTCVATGLTTPVSPATDGAVAIDGDDWGFGFNLGLLFELDERTRIGLAYRSRVSLELAGDGDFTLPPGGQALSAATGLFRDTAVTAETDLPESLALGVYRRVGARWAVMGDVTWTRWSRFDALVVEFANPVQPDNVTPEGWRNSVRYALGAEYAPGGAWRWRGGVAFDETPIPSAGMRTPRLPGNDRTWLALGFTWTPAPRLSLDFAYAHLVIEDSRIDSVEVNTGHRLTGKYENTTDIVSAQLRWRF